MAHRFLVIVHAGDAALQPQWLEGADARRWDLWVNCHGQDPSRWRDATPAVLRTDSPGRKWPALQRLLLENRPAWSRYEQIWFPDCDLVLQAEDINRLFDLAAGLQLELTQPSMSWDSDVDSVLTIHNPRFALRYSSFVEASAPCFSRGFLERALPTFDQDGGGWGPGVLWPQRLQSPATQCAILDRVQVTRRARPDPELHGDPGTGATGQPAGSAQAAGHSAPPLQLSYGGLDREGQRYNLFDVQGEAFVYRLCEGYAQRLAERSDLLGKVFAWHAQARSEYLTQQAPAARPGVASEAAPQASPAEALERFRAALKRAESSPAGRVLASLG